MPNYDRADDIVQGTCLCGAVAYRAQGPLYATSHCFCSQCQRQHGIAGSYGNVAAVGFTITRGADRITYYVKSPKGRCGFCRTCGSMLFWRGTDTPERVAITLGTIEPAWTGEVEREWFADQKQTWLPPAP
jgi:hypothetical protein